MPVAFSRRPAAGPGGEEGEERRQGGGAFRGESVDQSQFRRRAYVPVSPAVVRQGQGLVAGEESAGLQARLRGGVETERTGQESFQPLIFPLVQFFDGSGPGQGQDFLFLGAERPEREGEQDA